jgi:hypothetical protein
MVICPDLAIPVLAATVMLPVVVLPVALDGVTVIHVLPLLEVVQGQLLFVVTLYVSLPPLAAYEVVTLATV